MSDFNRFVRAVRSHFETKVSQLASRHSVVDRADPTEYIKSTGFVSFMYDPWVLPEELLLDPIPPCQTYMIEVDTMWGSWVKLYRADDPVTGHPHVEQFLDESSAPNPDPVQFDFLEKLLDGQFGKTRQDAERMPDMGIPAGHW